MLSIQKNHIQLFGRPFFYRETGEGPLLFLLHPSPSHSGSMEPLMQLLGTHFRVIAPDTPGYGQSASLDPAPETIEGYLPFIEQLVAHLQATRIFLYGTATGAQLAIAYALAHPEKINHLFPHPLLTQNVLVSLYKNLLCSLKIVLDYCLEK